MGHRQPRLYLVAVVLLMTAGFGCGYNQQSKFQMSFLPPVPHAPVLTAESIGDPPDLQPSVYAAAMPLAMDKLQALARPSRADQLAERAEQKFQRGKRLYQNKNFDRAREEFDGALDLMLEAGENNPVDRSGFHLKLDRMADAIHRLDLAGLGAAAAVEEAQFEKAPLEDILEMTFPIDPKMKNKVREQVKSTESQLPLVVNDTVLGYINYFSGRGKKTLIAGLQRAGRYRPLIQRILDEEGLPQELIHLAQAESGFLPRAVSRKQATGMWQFVAWRGQEYGLLRTPWYDDRLDPEKATRSAARHLRDLYHKFGDWYLAIAAYNCGPGTIEKAVERTGYVDFWELRSRRVIPAETTNYVPIILAMTIMAKNADEYGIGQVTPDAPIEYDNIDVTAPTHLALVSDLTGAPVSELMALNPALLRGVAPENYRLHVPKGTHETLRAALQLIPAERRASWRMHQVEGGDTLAGIAKRYGSAPNAIAAANNIEALPAEGDRIMIPAARPAPAAARTAARKAPAARRASSRVAAASRAPRKRPAVLTRTASSKRTGKPLP